MHWQQPSPCRFSARRTAVFVSSAYDVNTLFICKKPRPALHRIRASYLQRFMCFPAADAYFVVRCCTLFYVVFLYHVTFIPCFAVRSYLVTLLLTMTRINKYSSACRLAFEQWRRQITFACIRQQHNNHLACIRRTLRKLCRSCQGCTGGNTN